MSVTTSLKLPDNLKATIAQVAAFEGKTAHALMVDTLQSAMEDALARQQFYADGEAAYHHTLRTNAVYSGADVKAYVLARAAGGKAGDHPAPGAAVGCRQAHHALAQPPRMTELVYTEQTLSDLERLSDFLLETDPPAAQDTVALIFDALDILVQHPEVGRKVHFGQRELVISRAARATWRSTDTCRTSTAYWCWRCVTSESPGTKVGDKAGLWLWLGWLNRAINRLIQRTTDRQPGACHVTHQRQRPQDQRHFCH